MTVKIHLLDVGKAEYGDAVLCRFDDRSVLIDGAHPGNQESKDGHTSIPAQLSRLLDQQNPPYRVDLLVVTHGHQDHIGCLPFLVEHDLLEARFALVADPDFAWGRTGGPDVGPVPPSDAVRRLVAALREEPLSVRSDDDAVAELIADSGDLESRYRGMIERLQAAGTTVVRHGLDDPSNLLQEFAGIGLTVLGPSREHLEACRDIIAASMADLIEMSSDRLGEDAAEDAVAAYRRLLAGDHGVDAADASDRSGAAINLQSIVTVFEGLEGRFLLAGDLQWSRPGVDNQVVRDSVRDLRQRVASLGPYSFVKLSHHGSDNAMSAEIFAELGDSSQFGICAGEDSSSHPNASVLGVLDEHSDDIWWLRTDHNRAGSYTFDSQEIVAEWERGDLNDPVPNTGDAPAEASTLGGPQVVQPRSAGLPLGGGPEGTVEVTTRIPNAPTRVTVSVEIEPGSPTVVERGEPDRPRGAGGFAVELAPGRTLPPLLFVTNRDALAANIGPEQADATLAAVRAKAPLVDDVSSVRVSDAVTRVRQEIRSRTDLKGVVVIGGYDVVPSLIVDCLPAGARAGLDEVLDADNYLVWSDDGYGDRNGDMLPELPVSRIPDAKSAELVRASLQAGAVGQGPTKLGIRNRLRAFADDIFARLPGESAMLESNPTLSDVAPPFSLEADLVYVMLHGDFDDSSRYWGEEPVFPVAVGLVNLPAASGRVVFAGCCWGALTVTKRASRTDPDVPLATKTLESSLALSFLRNGCLAFVGCTGSHYSPAPDGPLYAGGPMHKAFWTRLLAGAGPSRALFEAKSDYAQGMFHEQTSAVQQAIEYKILREFTCLGLGW